MAKKIDLLLSNPELSHQMGENGHEIFHKKFSPEKIASQFLDICQNVIKNYSEVKK
jgi:glycosyltransferase involved in cell wall biosynthesis